MAHSTITNGQTCLEKRGITERNDELARSDYNKDNEYGPSHPNALSDGDVKGKGTGHGGHGDWLPDCNKPTGMIDYSNFDTMNGGGLYDIEGRPEIPHSGRNAAMARSLYNREEPYGSGLIDTKVNVADGQYVNRS